MEDSAELEFVQKGSVCAIAPEESSSDPVWFIKIENIHEEIDTDITDDYHHTVKKGSSCIEGRFLEHYGASTKTELTFELSKKMTYFYKDSIVYPLVSFREKKPKHVFIKKTDHFDVVNYVSHYGMSII